MTDARLQEAFTRTREQSRAICAPLATEDYGLQAAEFASPPKWHLAHTSWFFETFLLKPFLEGYEPLDPRYEVLFNSYYNGIGEQHPRGRRGLLSRPLLDEVFAYRDHVDSAMQMLFAAATGETARLVAGRTGLGIEHERQHQELFFTDIKYSLAANPMLPAYLDKAPDSPHEVTAQQWLTFPGGLVDIGHGGDGFAFDNELPRHPVYLQPFELADRLVTNAEYQEFVDDGGYERPDLWLADGWACVQSENWTAPLHWLGSESGREEFTLYGPQSRNPAAPVCHVSGYEADAFARWANARLPTEAEWETAAMTNAEASPGHTSESGENRGMDSGHYHPRPAQGSGMRQLYGACWQWTQSAYSPYPGFSPSAGAIGEYNGKFMSNQWVLRGGSCVTKASQARPTYRNFFYPRDRWQFGGIRLAR